MKFINHIHNIVLFAILVAGIALLFMTQGNRQLQTIIISAIAVSYVVWGVGSHIMRGDIHKKIVIEYILVSLIAVVIAFTLTI